MPHACCLRNPAVEMQAIQRAHRIGQTRAVEAQRFITKGTIEERMLALQEKKQLVFEGTVGGEAKSLSKLTEEDLRFLFKN
jgi:DNA repair protein RAD16|eukprot:COSAG01_NODE_6278_length_3758_cov_6.618748_3_plen_81_part_00